MLKHLLFLFLTFGFHPLFSQTWQQTTDFPSTERDDATVFVIGNNAYCGSGLLPWFSSTADFYALDMNTDSWTAISSLPSGSDRQYACGFSSANKGYVTCGTNSSYLNDTWMYDPSANAWSAKTPLPSAGRMGSCSFVINNIAYIIGGRTAASLSIKEVWAYDIINDSWTRKNDLPFGARWRASASAINNKGFLLFGRDENNRFCNELYEYDPSADSWTLKSSFPLAGRDYSEMQALSSDLIIVGGLDTLNASYNDMWRINPDSLNWQQLASIPAAGRRGGVCFTNGSALYYSTGIDQSNTRLKETWKVENPTGIAEISTMEDLHLFPNPANEVLNIQTGHAGNTTILVEINDTFGRIVYREIFKQEMIRVNTSGFSNGLYSIRISNGNAIYKSKVVVVH